MKTTKSTIKTDVEGYNNMPSRATLESKLLQMSSPQRAIRIVDTDQPWWMNDTDTLVIAIDCWDVASCAMIANAYELFAKLGADEIDHKMHCDSMVIRVWWD